MTLPIDPQRLLDLFAMIARGLVWYHWQVRLTIDDSVVPCALTPAGEERFDRLFSLNVAAHVERDLGNGTFQYEGAQDVDEHRVTIWRFRPYGGVWFGDPSAPGVVARRIGVLTGPGRRSAVDRSERCDEGPAAFDAPTGQEASPSKLQAGSIG